jgi:hypothetical protein
MKLKTTNGCFQDEGHESFNLSWATWTCSRSVPEPAMALGTPRVVQTHEQYPAPRKLDVAKGWTKEITCHEMSTPGSNPGANHEPYLFVISDAVVMRETCWTSVASTADC